MMNSRSRAELHCSRENEFCSKRDQGHDTERAEHIHRRIVNPPNSHDYKGGAAQFIAGLIETLVLILFARETLDLANSASCRAKRDSWPTLHVAVVGNGDGRSAVPIRRRQPGMERVIGHEREFPAAIEHYTEDEHDLGGQATDLARSHQSAHAQPN